MKTTRLGFYTTSDTVAGDFVTVAESFTQSWYVKDLVNGAVEDLSRHISAKSEADDLIFFGSGATGKALLDELETLANVCAPDTEVYVFSAERDVLVYRQIVGLGVAGCEGLPVEADFISQAISAFLNTEENGKLILGATIFPGVGFSSTFFNIASRCAYRIGPNQSVSFVDGDYTAGITNLFVSETPRSYVQFDTTAKTDFFDGSVVCDSGKFENMHVFPTPARSLEPRAMSSSFLGEGLSQITSKSEYTFVDFGLFNSLRTCQAMEYCDHVFLATRPTLNGMRVMREVMQNIFEMRGAIEKISCLIIGRGRSTKNELKPKKIREILPNVAIFEVPDAPSYVYSQENSGTLGFQGKRARNGYEKSIDKICKILID
jgi:cellulose biosynthesis protein BcsQ